VVNAFNGDLAIPLGDLAGQAKRWRPSAGEPRALTAQLTRRLLFLKSPVAGSAELARYQSCENRSVAAFLRP
jgi:hypothetical protein